MGAHHTLGAGDGVDVAQVLRDECGTEPHRWRNGPGDRYGAHSHPYHKVLFCERGSITFHTAEGDIAMHAGDRLDLEPATEHWATVGPDGVACIEAARA